MKAPEAPYKQSFPDEESTRSMSVSESCKDIEDNTGTEDLASDDEATDMSDADGFMGENV